MAGFRSSGRIAGQHSPGLGCDWEKALLTERLKGSLQNRHQGIIDVPPQTGVFSVSATVAKGLAWRTTSAPFVDSLPGLVWTALPDGQVDFLNLHWCAYTGLGVDEAYGSGWQLAIHPADRPGLLERWRSILAAGEPGRMEARLRRFDGEYRWFQFCTTPPLVDASGQIVEWCGTGTDVDDLGGLP